MYLYFSLIENLYETLEFGTGSNPANVASRQRVLTGRNSVGSFLISDSTLWVAATIRDSVSGFKFQVSDDGCIIESLFKDHGVITSPSYPLSYPNDADCIWIIQITGLYRVHLTFHDFETESYYDRLFVGGVSDGSNREYLEFSGNSLPDDVYSNLNGLSLRFESDGTNNAKGFNISYRVIYNCPDGYIAGNDGETCYKFVEEPNTWVVARQDCLQTPNSDLVVIQDAAEAAYIQRYMTEANQDWWIGLSDLPEEGSWVWVDCQYVPAGNLSWAVTEPTNSTVENCVRFNMDGQYTDDMCNQTFPYICKEDKGFGSDEQNPSRFMVSSKTAHLINLSWTPSSLGCYVSGYQLITSSNGSIVSDQMFEPTVTSARLSNLTPATNYSFELITYAFVEGPLEGSLKLLDATDVQLECPLNYQLNVLNNKCYQVNQDELTWVEARRQCLQTHDADLVIIDSEEAEDNLNAILESNNIDIWFGLYDWDADNTWSQINTCQRPAYDNFQLNYTYTEPNCAVMLDANGWDSQPCNETNAFVCEYFPRDSNETSVNPNFVRVDLLEPTTVQMYWTPSIRLCDVLGYVVNNTKVGESPTYYDVDDPRGNAKVFFKLDTLTEYEFSVSAKTVTYGTLPADSVERVLTGVMCPLGYDEGNDYSCYKFVKEAVTWEEARNDCSEDGAYLINIDTNVELLYVRRTTLTDTYWIGFNDIVSEGSWYWSDCSMSNTWQESNWAPGQPGNLNTIEHCGELTITGQWNDANCGRTNYYICEIPKEGIDTKMQNPSMLDGTTISYNRVNLTWTPSPKRCDVIGYTITEGGDDPVTHFIAGGNASYGMVSGLEPESNYTFMINAKAFYDDLPLVANESVRLTTFVKAEGECPYKYEKINGVCYKFSSESVTWTDAQRKCMEDDAVLVIIEDEQEKTMLMDRTSGDLWIGLNDQVEEGSFFWGDCNVTSPWQQQQWGPDEPINEEDDQDCVVMMSSGTWNVKSCDQINKYVCEFVEFDYDINPRSFSGEATSAFSVTLQWTPSPQNCEVLEYRIMYSNPSIQTVIPGKDSDMTVIDGLQSNTMYMFSISAFTAWGNVGYSEAITVATQNFTNDACNGQPPFTDSTGNITSPNFPSPYPPNANCAYQVTLTDAKSRVRLSFMDIDLIGMDDSLIITDLNSGVESPQMLTLSGTNIPKDYLSMSNSVEVRFVSGSSLTQGTGFWIVYKEDEAELPLSKQCQYAFTLKSGTSLRIQSSSYPNQYPNYENCTWTLTASESSDVIAVNFFDLDLEPAYDRLSFNGQTVVTGDVLPKTIFSTSDVLTFTMTSDYSITGRGFSLSAEQVDPNLITDKTITMLDSQKPHATCGSTVNVTVGSQDITSPLYPNNYENNVNCVWKIMGSENNGIVIQFNKFDVEYGYDYILVGVGDDELDVASIVGRFSGPNLPSKMVVDGNNAWIQLISDDSVTAGGFDLSVYSKPSCVQNKLVIPDGGNIELKSVNNPSPYDDNEYCLYQISSRRGSFIRFQIRMLDVEEGYDFLSFGSGQDPMELSSKMLIATGSMSQQSDSYSTKSNQLWIMFTSDATTTGDGYIIDVYDDSCGINSLFGSGGQISSPSYPMDYPNNADCIWIIQVSGEFNIELTFKSFDLETGRDFLVVGGVTLDQVDDQTVVLTGSELPESIVSTSNGLNIQLNSDLSTTSKGFDLTWKAIYKCPVGYSAGNDNVTCYKFSSESKTWFDARLDCLSTPGGDLVIINDKAENDYVNKLIGDDSWIGFYDGSVEEEWFWVDCLTNTDWAESNWATGQPDNGNGADCAQISSATGLYDDKDCTIPMKYVCEQYERLYNDDDATPTRFQAVASTESVVTLTWRRPVRYCDVLGYSVRFNGTNGDVLLRINGSETTSLLVYNLAPDTTYIFEVASILQTFGLLPYEQSATVKTFKPVDELCPDGWVVGPSFTCYRFSDVSRTWSDARKDCMSVEDGDLVIIEDESEHAYIQNMTNMKNDWWIGFYDQATEDSWRWVDCSSPNIWQRSQWARGQPDDSNGQSDCGQMNDAGQWEDETCSNKNYYICEKRKKPFSPNEANPTLFRGQALNPVSASFSWRPSRLNCDVTGYKINYQDGVKTMVMEVAGADTSSAVVRDLIPGTIYIFSIAATTMVGDLSYGQFRPIRTLNESVQCPFGYEIGYDYNCFKFSLTSRTWDDARADCQSSLNSDLAKIDTPEALDYVMNVRNITSDYWIGYYDVAVEGKWQWVDCTAPSNFTLSNWGVEQPDDVVGSQDCGQLRSNGKYHDLQCLSRSQYICQVIPKNFVPEDFNPRLFTAVSFSPDNAILTWRPTDINCDIEGYSIRYNINNTMKTMFVPGALTNAANVTGLQPSTTYQFELAAVLTTGTLAYEAVASATTLPAGDPCSRFDGWETGFGGACYRFVTSATPVSWNEARKECMKAENGDLVLIKTKTESEYIRNKTNTNSYWIGYSDETVEGDWHWLDCSPPSSWASSFWLDNEPDNTDTENCGYYVSNILREGFGDDVCASEYAQYICEISEEYDPDAANPSMFKGSVINPNTVELTWQISDVICDVDGYQIEYSDPVKSTINVPGASTNSVRISGLKENRQYTFSIAAYSELRLLTFDTSTTVKTPSFSGHCPSGWELIDYACYKFVNNSVSWHDARADCQATSGGDLAIIDTEAELQNVMERTQGDWWVGLHDQSVENDWTWVDCSSIGSWGESNWQTNQPNDQIGNQDCVEMRNNGRFNDLECDMNLFYICEIINNTRSDVNPSKLRGEALSPNDVRLTWTPSPQSCEVSGYKVFINSALISQTYINVTGGKTDELLVKGLTASTQYVFTIATYTIDGKEPLLSDIETVTTPSVGVCGDTERNEATGKITSPNYPKVYPDNQDCVYVISIPDTDGYIQVEFYSFDLEDGHDFLLMGPGDIADNNIEQYYTGKALPIPVVIKNNKMWIRFFSDEYGTAGGFDLQYATVPGFTTKEPGMSTFVDPIDVGGTLVTFTEESYESFDEEKQLAFAESLAEQATDFCSESILACLAPRESVYKSDNIEYYSFVQINSNLEVKFWISDPTNNKVAAMTTEQVQAMLSENKDGSEFEYIIGPVENPTPVDANGLQPWAITLISFLAVCLAVMIFVVVKDRKSSKKDLNNSKFDLEEMQETENSNISDTPQRRSSQHTSEIFFESPNGATNGTTNGATKGANKGANNGGFQPDTVPDTSMSGVTVPSGSDSLPQNLPDAVDAAL
ncbi:uncharacterized protein [Antedon mediterranea]|uniref:uncharacterized protein n=1 Tax=Antedon mediterranea TaxID=105859 RepID=UPI003AF65C6C